MGTDNANRAMHARTVKASHLLERRSRSPAMRCTSCVCEMIGAARRERYQVLLYVCGEQHGARRVCLWTRYCTWTCTYSRIR